MRALSAVGTLGGSVGAAFSSAARTDPARAAAPRSKAQATASCQRLLFVTHEDRSATPGRLDVTVLPCQHHLKGGGRGTLLDDDIDEIRHHSLVVHADHCA